MAGLFGTILTAGGINALANASATGTSIKPKYFKFSNQDLQLDPNLSAEDIVGWRTQDINAYLPVSNGELKFVCIVEPSEATDYTRICGLFLEDGTLFMVAKPQYVFPPTFRQILNPQMKYANYGEIIDFTYLNFSETEQDLSSLNSIVVNGNQILKNTLKIEGIKIEGVN